MDGNNTIGRNITVIEEYQTNIFKLDLYFFTGCCTCAAVTFAGLKFLGFYSSVSWLLISIFIALNILWDTIGIILIKKSVKNGELNKKVYNFGKCYVLFVLFVQYNFILYAIPTRDFWGYTCFFLIFSAYFLDLKMIIIAAIEMIASLTIACFINEKYCLPIKDDIFITDLILRAVVIFLFTIAIYLLVQFVSKYLLSAKKEELEENTKKTEQALNYITEISDVLNQIANGNLTYKLKYDYVGEFSSIKNALDNISESLNTIMNQIRISSEDVFHGANQFSSSAQELSNSSSSQASTIEQLTASIASISDRTQDNTQYIVDSSHYVKTAITNISDCNLRMTDMLSAMSEINNSSTEISKIIKVIDDIAFQTNILALNAAVEAARAGSAGRGFAVVADEVRNLASKSADAANQTTLLIQQSISLVGNGTKIAEDTAESLNTVAESSNLFNDTLEKISAASNEQSESIQQIYQGLEQISSAVQNNSATAEESAAASEELSTLADRLKAEISKFILKK